jgi:hypothetical protein
MYVGFYFGNVHCNVLEPVGVAAKAFKVSVVLGSVLGAKSSHQDGCQG